MFWFQSTRPRGARHHYLSLPCAHFLFQSTRPRGARHHAEFLGVCKSAGFNPRARAGRDARGRGRLWRHRRFQSTRPRGARHFSNSGAFADLVFQSTRPRGARRGPRADVLRFLGFNPRARAGRDLKTLSPVRRVLCFNPRARAGRDAIEGLVAFAYLFVSIHAPARGATISHSLFVIQ